jgi:hypothetical protein
MAHGIDRAFENVHLIRFPARAHVKPVPLVAAGAVHPELAVAVCTAQAGESGRARFIVAYKHDVMAPVLNGAIQMSVYSCSFIHFVLFKLFSSLLYVPLYIFPSNIFFLSLYIFPVVFHLEFC